jgi:hypothetical protein
VAGTGVLPHEGNGTTAQNEASQSDLPSSCVVHQITVIGVADLRTGRDPEIQHSLDRPRAVDPDRVRSNHDHTGQSGRVTETDLPYHLGSRFGD